MEVGTNIVAAAQKLIDTFMSLINADIIPVSTAEEKKKQFLSLHQKSKTLSI